MDALRFDALARALSRPGSRRRTLAAFLSSALGVGSAAAGTPDEVAARRKRKKHKRKQDKDKDKNKRKTRRQRDRKVKVEGPCGNGRGKANRCQRDRQCCTNYCKKHRCRCRKPGQSCQEDRNCCPERTGRSCFDGTCQPTPACAATCPAGCCAGQTCEPGTSDAACGINGESCQACGSGQLCVDGI